MKNLRINLQTTLALTFLIHLMSLSVGWSADRKVLLEDYTSTTCPPCAAAAAALEGGIEAAGDDVVAAIAIHVWWPGAGNDPWYLDNPDECRQRTSNFYGVRGVPTYYIDGSVYGGQRSVSGFRDALLAAQDDEAPVSLDLSAVIVSDQLMVSATITAEDDLEDVRLYLSLNEDHVQYNAPTGQRDHYDAMVKMVPDARGTPFSIEQDETIEFNFIQDMEGLGWHELELDNLIVVGWVQGNDRAVHQAQNFFNLTEFSNSLEFVEGEGANDDGRFEPGETGEIIVTITNPENGVDLEQMRVVLTTDDDAIQIENGEFTFDFLEDGEDINNNDSPIIFRVPENAEPHPVTFYFEYTSEFHNFSVVEETVKMIGWPPFLVVSSTSNDRAGEWLIEQFGANDLPWTDHFNRVNEGLVNEVLLQNYSIVLWHSFNETEDIISEFEEEIIEQYLDDGGTVIFSSYGFVQARGNSRLMRDYFHAELDDNDTGERFIHGEADVPYFGGVRLFTGGGNGPGSPVDSPSINALEDGVPITFWGDRNGEEHYGVNGVMYEGENFRTLLFSFPLESITGFLATHDLANFMNRIWSWYNHGDVSVPPDDNDFPVQFGLYPAFPNPFNSSIVVPFSLETRGMVSLSVFDLSGRQVTTLIDDDLPEGSHRVDFDGDLARMSNGVYYLKLISGSNAAGQKILYLK